MPRAPGKKDALLKEYYVVSNYVIFNKILVQVIDGS